jgi:hypothetical protein
MVDKKSTKSERDTAYREAFLARLSARLAVPTAEWPTVRCWTAQSLKRLTHKIRDELAANGVRSDLTDKSLLMWLSHLGLEREIAADGETFHVLEIGASAEALPDPLELLLARRPAGVICYFTAVAFHSLTTQPVSHHHIAELQDSSPGIPQVESEAKDTARGRVDSMKPPPAGSTPRLGTLLFRYGDTPYYVTRRSRRLVPGAQSRGYGPRTQLRITTFEQTLLDTLYKPFHCGGPEVAFEAWHEAWTSGRVDEDRLTEYLEQMRYPATTRRVGVMLGMVGQTPGGKLRRVLDRACEGIDRESPFARISLLPGVEYKNLNEQWLVHTP